MLNLFIVVDNIGATESNFDQVMWTRLLIGAAIFGMSLFLHRSQNKIKVTKVTKS